MCASSGIRVVAFTVASMLLTGLECDRSDTWESPAVVNRTDRPIEVRVVWENGVVAPPIRVLPGGTLDTSVKGYSVRRLEITVEDHTTSLVEKPGELLDDGLKPVPGFEVFDGRLGPLTREQVVRFAHMTERMEINLESLGLTSAFRRSLDDTIDLLNRTLRRGMKREDIEDAVSSLDLDYAVGKGSFHEFPVLIGRFKLEQTELGVQDGYLEVQFDSDGTAKTIRIETQERFY